MWLLSAGKEPEQSVVIWDVETAAAVTSGTTSQPVTALAWRPSTLLPAFLTLSKVMPDTEADSVSGRVSKCQPTCKVQPVGRPHCFLFDSVQFSTIQSNSFHCESMQLNKVSLGLIRGIYRQVCSTQILSGVLMTMWLLHTVLHHA